MSAVASMCGAATSILMVPGTLRGMFYVYRTNPWVLGSRGFRVPLPKQTKKEVVGFEPATPYPNVRGHGLVLYTKHTPGVPGTTKIGVAALHSGATVPSYSSTVSGLFLRASLSFSLCPPPPLPPLPSPTYPPSPFLFFVLHRSSTSSGARSSVAPWLRWSPRFRLCRTATRSRWFVLKTDSIHPHRGGGWMSWLT